MTEIQYQNVLANSLDLRLECKKRKGVPLNVVWYYAHGGKAGEHKEAMMAFKIILELSIEKKSRELR